MTTLRAASASVDITLPPGGMMDGYGSRLSPTRGVPDPLFARVLMLDYSDAVCAIVACDLLGVHPWLAAEVRRRVRESLGMSASSPVTTSLRKTRTCLPSL